MASYINSLVSDEVGRRHHTSSSVFQLSEWLIDSRQQKLRERKPLRVFKACSVMRLNPTQTLVQLTQAAVKGNSAAR